MGKFRRLRGIPGGIARVEGPVALRIAVAIEHELQLGGGYGLTGVVDVCRGLQQLFVDARDSLHATEAAH